VKLSVASVEMTRFGVGGVWASVMMIQCAGEEESDLRLDAVAVEKRISPLRNRR
jgi:hypothetical protein